MAWVFNPFSGKLDFAGSGGGSQYIDGEVQYYADLPTTVGTPPVNSAYLVREASGTWFVGRHPAGIYIRTANAGASTDWTYAGTFPDVFSDANFTIYNDANSSKEVQFDASLISNATTRTLTVPDASGTIALAENVVAKAGDTMTGKLIVAATDASSKLNIGVITGTTPTSITNGDLWITGGNRMAWRSGNVSYNSAITNLANTFNNNQTVDTSTSTPALRVTQRGTGEALRVEDETNPDATAFVVSASGRVGIGVTPDATAAIKVDSGGIKFNDDTVFTTATPSFPDNTFEIKDNTDPTRKVAFECSGISAATTRTLTIPNANGTIQLAQEVRSDFVTNTSYIGLAPLGSAESANVWTIYRNIIDSGGNITSTTTATNVAWDDRLTATYT